MMLMPASLTCRDGVVDLADPVSLVHRDQDALIGRLDAEREPVEPGVLQLVEHALLDGIDPRVRPDVQPVVALDQQIADAEHVPGVEDEHLVGELDVADAVPVDEEVDLLDDARRAPEAVAVDRLLDAEHLLAAP